MIHVSIKWMGVQCIWRRWECECKSRAITTTTCSVEASESRVFLITIKIFSSNLSLKIPNDLIIIIITMMMQWKFYLSSGLRWLNENPRWLLINNRFIVVIIINIYIRLLILLKSMKSHNISLNLLTCVCYLVAISITNHLIHTHH